MLCVKEREVGEGGAENSGSALSGWGASWEGHAVVWAGRAREHLFILHENDRRESPSSWKMGSCGGREGAVVRWARLNCAKTTPGLGQRGGGAVAGRLAALGSPLDYKD